MKAKSFLLATSLAANLALGWMLWQRPLATIPETAFAQAAPSEDESENLQLPTTPVPLSAPALLPPLDVGMFGAGSAAPPGAQARLLPPDEEKPYAPPPPPNPHAFPAWPERTPHRESQAPRALLTNPKR